MRLYLETEVEVSLVSFQGLNLKIIVKGYLSWQNEHCFFFWIQTETSLFFCKLLRLYFSFSAHPRPPPFEKIYFIFDILKCNIKTHFKISRSILALLN